QFKPMQLAAVEALQAPAEWYENMNAVYRKRRTFAEKIMEQLDCHYDADQVGLFVWGRVPDHIESAVALADRILYEANVFITPGIIFGSQGERYLRISLCCREEVLEEALERIRAIN
ncbi:aminotransferase class I/II-fold pyridoxal phosphate-dependent enzyme, partial [Parabacteroides sp. OttesenSCG-928-J18]|nr:aminotransferase class I/II-fold pyridoxal phosphate-dependent enzyme [Parabacteroides sp. OttesenSCG-928-J18]